MQSFSNSDNNIYRKRNIYGVSTTFTCAARKKICVKEAITKCVQNDVPVLAVALSISLTHLEALAGKSSTLVVKYFLSVLQVCAVYGLSIHNSSFIVFYARSLHLPPSLMPIADAVPPNFFTGLPLTSRIINIATFSLKFRQHLLWDEFLALRLD